MSGGAADSSLPGREIDAGRVWWPKGLAGQETVRILFNRALEQPPSGIQVEDYRTREPLDVEVVEFIRQGTGKWARWTSSAVRFKEPGERGRSFRWRLLA